MTDLYKALRESQIGDRLIEDLESRIDSIYDSRNWDKGMNIEAAHAAAKQLHGLVNNIKYSSERKKGTPTSFE